MQGFLLHTSPNHSSMVYTINARSNQYLPPTVVFFGSSAAVLTTPALEAASIFHDLPIWRSSRKTPSTKTFSIPSWLSTGTTAPATLNPFKPYHNP